ncbi:hypothetical protein VKT23_012495 [Stygiomarasmius scandens]|uniref:Uncharacterized protein n=1 Tax=Marasmiellus scandens TaxID=2682957 RepID=A0ABR1J8P5_9AGAR
MANESGVPNEEIREFEFFVVSNTAGGIFYGILIIMQIVLFMVFSRESFRLSKPRGVLLTICLTMFALSSVYFAATVALCLTSLRSWKNSVRQDSQLLENSLRLSQRLKIVQDVTYPINFFLSDVVVVWRAWVLVHGKYRVLLAVLLFASFCAMILNSLQDALPVYLQNTISFDIAALHIPLLLTNICATWMIGHAFWSSRRILKLNPAANSYDSSQQIHGPRRPWSEVERIFLIVIESGFLYLVVWFFSILADVGVLGDIASGTKDALLPHLAAIYPQMVFLLVASQKSQVNAVLAGSEREDLEFTEISVETIQFA